MPVRLLCVAENIVSAVVAKGTPHTLICDFWSQEVAKNSFPNQKFDVLLAQNVFAHVDDCHEFMKAATLVMHQDSMLYIQTSQCYMVQHNEFDTIYHEHLSFFCVLSMKTMAEAHGLYLNDVYISDIHGDSFLFIMSKHNKPSSVIQALEKEKKDGLYDLPSYTVYAQKCMKVVDDLKVELAKFKEQGYTLVGYGAAAKGRHEQQQDHVDEWMPVSHRVLCVCIGMTLLNFGHIDHASINYIVDDSPLKQGLYTPGSNIPIVSAKKLQEDQADKIVIIPLAWNFFNEIRSRVEGLLKGSSKQVQFVRYFPHIQIEQGKL